MTDYFQPIERFVAVALEMDHGDQITKLQFCRRVGEDMDTESVCPGDDELPEFVCDPDTEFVWLSYHADEDRLLLRQIDDKRLHAAILDVRQLTEVCFPMCSDLDPATRSGAPDEEPAVQILMLWEQCLEALRQMPDEVINALCLLLNGYRKNPLNPLFRAVRDERRGARRGSPEALARLLETPKRPRRKKAVDIEEQRGIDVEATVSILSENGVFAQKLTTYEPRPQQMEMTKAVCEAFREKKHLMVEAGTGIGKSFAYLIPAILWAIANKTAVVVSTNTKNLQAQLFEKDLPLLQEVLAEDFLAAIIKGRRNYLCIRRLVYLLSHVTRELDRRERMEMLRVVSWSVVTKAGDVGECCSAGVGGRSGLASKITTVAEDCSGRSCRFYKKCFLYTARARSMSADIVVANHSIVFAEMGLPVDSTVIPPHQHVIFDEVHNLEDAATNGFSKEVSAARLGYVLGRICRVKKRKMQGLVPSLQEYIAKQRKIPDIKKDELVMAGDRLMELVRETGTFIQPFFGALACILEDRQGRLRDSVRLRPYHRESEDWAPVQEISRSLRGVLKLVGEISNELADELGNMTPEMGELLPEFSQEVKAVSLWLDEFCGDMGFILNLRDEEYVSWIEKVPGREGTARAWAAPVDVGKILNEKLYQEKNTVVFTSATLAVRGSAAFMKSRLGIDLIPPARLTELGVGTPFDYPKQCLAMIPTFLPEPGAGEGDYAGELGELLAKVFHQTNGRGMALFTSYDMLRRTTAVVTKEMKGGKHRILAQGITGSRESITETFRKDISSVLMGTHSFWEGVDVVGEALSCVVIARLPFAVFTDPIIEARCERIEQAGGNPFLEYSVPQAVIRFRQGFGRLIRHRDDRGIVIIADRRLITKRYGSWFYGSLPLQCLTYATPEDMIGAISGFLGAGETNHR